MCCVELFVVYNFWFLLDLLLNPNPIVFFSIFFLMILTGFIEFVLK